MERIIVEKTHFSHEIHETHENYLHKPSQGKHGTHGRYQCFGETAGSRAKPAPTNVFR